MIIGDFSLSRTQSEAQMAVWSVLAAPLIMSNDVRTISKEDADILQNRGALRVSQDRLGRQGTRVYNNKVRESS